MMIPIILISSLAFITTLKSLIIANFCLMLIKMIKIFLWYETVFKNKKIDNPSFKKSVKKYLIIEGVIVALLLLNFINIYLMFLTLSISLIINTVYIRTFLSKYRNVDQDKLPNLNLELLKGRSMLLMILVFGEGLIISSHIIDIKHLDKSITMFVLLFFCMSFFFLRFYEDFTKVKLLKGQGFKFLSSVLMAALVFLLIFSIEGVIVTKFTWFKTYKL